MVCHTLSAIVTLYILKEKTTLNVLQRNFRFWGSFMKLSIQKAQNPCAQHQGAIGFQITTVLSTFSILIFVCCIHLFFTIWELISPREPPPPPCFASFIKTVFCFSCLKTRFFFIISFFPPIFYLSSDSLPCSSSFPHSVTEKLLRSDKMLRNGRKRYSVYVVLGCLLESFPTSTTVLEPSG